MVAHRVQTTTKTTDGVRTVNQAPYLNKPLPQDPPHSPGSPLHQRTDPAGIVLRQHHAAVSALSAHQGLQASIRAGITSPRPANRPLTQSPTEVVTSENLRSQL